MTQTQAQPMAADTGDASAYVAPDCRGMNFYDIDRDFQALLALRMEPKLRAHLEPHLHRLGDLAGGRLDELADIAERNPPPCSSSGTALAGMSPGSTTTQPTGRWNRSHSGSSACTP